MDFRPNILLVEDDQSVREIIKRVLIKMGCHVWEAATAEEALTISQTHLHETHLLLADIVLPGEMNGHELAAKLLPQNPKLKVLYTSGFMPGYFEKEVRLVEGVNFLSKPYTSKKLQTTIEQIIG